MYSAALIKWRCGMKARTLIDGASFGSETVKAIGEAFDEASLRIKIIFGNDIDAVEAASIRLAEAILSIATESNTDVEDLKNCAVVELAKTTGPSVMRE
jgi:hypothetical protein